MNIQSFIKYQTPAVSTIEYDYGKEISTRKVLIEKIDVDLHYFQKKLLTSLKIPSRYLST